jgi:hypothetical protein
MNILSFEQNVCKKMRGCMDSYLHSETAGRIGGEMLAHLESCAACAGEFEARSRLKNRLRQAVLDQEPPVELRDRIQRSMRKGAFDTKSAFDTWRPWTIAAAAALVLAACAWGVLRDWDPPRSMDSSYQASLAASDAEILQIGLRNHAHCAIEARMADRVFTPERMTEELGADFAALVPLVKQRAPGNYRIVVAHRCRMKGRQFVHMILRDQERVLSLTLTRKNGEAFSEEKIAGLLEAADVRLRSTRLTDYEVTGFETRDHLAFIVSDLVKEKNLQIAASLAPAVRDYLARLES